MLEPLPGIAGIVHRLSQVPGGILRTHQLILEGLLSKSTEVYEHGNAENNRIHWKSQSLNKS